MTILYEVKTGHTKKVLKAFSKLYAENRNGDKRMMMQYGVMAAFFLMMPKIFNLQNYGRYISWAVGILIVVVAFKRDYLTYLNLLSKDVYYRNGVEIRMSFGNSLFTVRDGRENTYRYDQIDEMFRDDEMLYLHMDNEDVFVIPREDFVKGTPDDFSRYLQLNTGKDFKKINLSLGERFDKYQEGLREKSRKRKGGSSGGE